MVFWLKGIFLITRYKIVLLQKKGITANKIYFLFVKLCEICVNESEVLVYCTCTKYINLSFTESILNINHLLSSKRIYVSLCNWFVFLFSFYIHFLLRKTPDHCVWNLKNTMFIWNKPVLSEYVANFYTVRLTVCYWYSL